MLAIACLVLTLASCRDGGGSAPTPSPSPVSTEVPVPTSTVERLAFPAACEVQDPDFCTFAEAVDQALQRGDIDFVLANTRVKSYTCPAGMELGPCAHQQGGVVLRGYFVGAAHTDGGFYYSEAEYRSLLERVASVDAAATDDYGDGTWRLAAIMDHGPRNKVLASTTIGPDPLYDDPADSRRAFTLAASLGPDGWRVDSFFTYTTGLIDEPLRGVSFVQSEQIEGWAPWRTP
jgi:hypothetical protein